jgi:hypothetical protein
VDPDFGKQQLDLMLRESYMHPNGQIPAYEWNFGDIRSLRKSPDASLACSSATKTDPARQWRRAEVSGGPRNVARVAIPLNATAH